MTTEAWPDGAPVCLHSKAMSPRMLIPSPRRAAPGHEMHSDAALVNRLQRGAFDYLWRYGNPDNGLVADTSRPGSPCSIAVLGFALSAYIVAVERGWLSRTSAAERAGATLQFLLHSKQADAPDATGYRGFYYHFLDMHSGRRVWNCELSLIDTTLLLAGVLSVGLYFDRPGEGAIRADAQA